MGEGFCLGRVRPSPPTLSPAMYGERERRLWHSNAEPIEVMRLPQHGSDPLALLCIEPRFPGKLGAAADWLVRHRGYRCHFYCDSAAGRESWPPSVGAGLMWFSSMSAAPPVNLPSTGRAAWSAPAVLRLRLLEVLELANPGRSTWSSVAPLSSAPRSLPPSTCPPPRWSTFSITTSTPTPTT